MLIFQYNLSIQKNIQLIAHKISYSISYQVPMKSLLMFFKFLLKLVILYLLKFHIIILKKFFQLPV